MMTVDRHLVLTGGRGFVGGQFLRDYLDYCDRGRVTVVDTADPDPLTLDSIADHLGRVDWLVRDLRSPDALDEVGPPTHVVHAATVTHLPDWEVTTPRMYIDVNVTGTLNVLEWARKHQSVRRFIQISSGAVYGRPTPASPRAAQGEDGPFNPPELYAISKHCSEQLARRYGDLFFSVVAIRLPTVFGPMERPTAARATMSLPYQMMASALTGSVLRVTERTLDAVGDFVSSEDVALAILGLLEAPEVGPVYNIAYGQLTEIRSLLDAFCAVEPSFQWATAQPGPGVIDLDPTARLARDNAYSIERITRTTGWVPRSLPAQLRTYHRWARQNTNALVDPDAASIARSSRAVPVSPQGQLGTTLKTSANPGEANTR